MFSNNISGNIPTNKKVNHLLMTHPLLLESDTQLILSYNIILELIIPILQPFRNIFSIFHKAFNMKLQTFLCFFCKASKVGAVKTTAPGTLLPREPP